MKVGIVYLHPGEFFLGQKPSKVSTVLGSCISVTMFSERMRFGAISHCLLPVNVSIGREDKQSGSQRLLEKNSAESNDLKSDVCFRFVEPTISFMVEEFIKRGITKSEIEVKLFGGSEILSRGKTVGRLSVGRQNVDMAQGLLKKEGFTLSACDTGGVVGRKLIFLSHTGDVFIKRLGKQSIEEMVS